MESISTQQPNVPNNGVPRDDDYRKRILQSMCTFIHTQIANFHFVCAVIVEHLRNIQSFEKRRKK